MKKINKTLIIFGVVVAAIVCIVVLSVIFSRKGNSKNEMAYEALDSELPILIEKNGKFGYVSYSGKMLVEPKYDTAEDFYGDYAKVKIGEGNNGINSIIDKNGKEIYTTDYGSNLYHAREYGFWIIENKLYDEKLKQLTPDEVKVDYIEKGYMTYKNTKNNVVGIMNSKGKSIFQYSANTDSIYIYARIEEDNLVNDERYAEVNIQYYDENTSEDFDKNAIISCNTGKVIYDFTNDDIYAEEDNIFRISDENNDDEKCVYIEGDEIVYETKNGLEFDSYSDKILEVEDYDNDEVKYYDIPTRKEYNNRSDIKETQIARTVMEGSDYEIVYDTYSGRYGVKLKENTIIPMEYREIVVNPYIYNYAKKNKNEEIVFLEKQTDIIEKKATMYDLKNKKELFSCFVSSYGIDEDKISSFIDGLNENKEKKIVYNFITEKSMEFSKDSYVDTHTNYIIVEENNVKTYYDKDFKEIYRIEE